MVAPLAESINWHEIELRRTPITKLLHNWAEECLVMAVDACFEHRRHVQDGKRGEGYRCF